jgi:hypothetical protein
MAGASSRSNTTIGKGNNVTQLNDSKPTPAKPERRPHTELRLHPGKPAPSKQLTSSEKNVPQPKDDNNWLEELFNNMPV